MFLCGVKTGLFECVGVCFGFLVIRIWTDYRPFVFLNLKQMSFHFWGFYSMTDMLMEYFYFVDSEVAGGGSMVMSSGGLWVVSVFYQAFTSSAVLFFPRFSLAPPLFFGRLGRLALMEFGLASSCRPCLAPFGPVSSNIIFALNSLWPNTRG